MMNEEQVRKILNDGVNIAVACSYYTEWGDSFQEGSTDVYDIATNEEMLQERIKEYLDKFVKDGEKI